MSRTLLNYPYRTVAGLFDGLFDGLRSHGHGEFKIHLRANLDGDNYSHAGVDPCPAVYVVGQGHLVLVPSVEGVKDMQAIRAHAQRRDRCSDRSACSVECMGIPPERFAYAPPLGALPLMSWSKQREMLAAASGTGRGDAGWGRIYVYDPAADQLERAAAAIILLPSDGVVGVIGVQVPEDMFAALGDAWENVNPQRRQRS